MRRYVYDTQLEMARQAARHGAELIRKALTRCSRANIIMATGASQFELLEALTQEPNIDWNRVTGFHLDEYVGLPITHDASFRAYLWRRFLSKLPLPMQDFHFLNAETEPEAEASRVGGILRAHPIDVAFIGIGENGHIAFNDPPADFDTEEPYIVVKLDEACRRQQYGEGWFPDLNSVPERAISMSVRQILKSSSIICTVPEERKAEAVRAALEDDISPTLPASILRKHRGCHLYLDESSASRLS